MLSRRGSWNLMLGTIKGTNNKTRGRTLGDLTLLGLVKRESTQDHCPCVPNATITTKGHVLPGVISARRSAIWLMTVGVLAPMGHYKKDCPKLKNGNRGNQCGNGNAPAKVYVVGNAGTNPDSNVVTEEIAIDAIPLAKKSPKIVDWKIYKEGRKSYYELIRADGKSHMYRIFSQMLESFDREDLEDLYKLVKSKFEHTWSMRHENDVPFIQSSSLPGGVIAADERRQKEKKEQPAWLLDSGNMEMESDIENMTISEYLELKCERKMIYWSMFDPEEVQ
ncbi:hypothetical protein Tco_1522414 [Tanacetum coccineum]